MEASRHFAEIVALNGPIVCDVHYAVQPNLDTSYALKLPFIERFDDDMEPYQSGINRTFVNALMENGAVIKFVLIQSPIEDILFRRNELLKNLDKQPRSLDRQSIVIEQLFEQFFFKETIDYAGKSYPIHSIIIENPNPSIDCLLNNMRRFIDKGGNFAQFIEQQSEQIKILYQ